MIDLVSGIIKIGGRESSILGYECWWTVPGRGLFPDLQAAIFASNGQAIITTPVALGKDGLYEVLPPEVDIGNRGNDSG